MEPENTMLDTGTVYTAARIPVVELNSALAFLNRVILSKTSLPILQTVYFPGDGTLQATDLDITARYSVSGAKGHMPFTVALTALQRALKGADKGGFCVIEPTGQDGKIRITADGLTSTVESLPASDFPLMPLAGDGLPTRFLMTAAAFVDWMGFIAPCVSTELTRYYLNGVYIHPKDGVLCGVATDGHKLAIKNVDCAWVKEPRVNRQDGVIVPTQAVVIALAAVGTKPKGDLHISVYDQHVTVTHAEWTLCTKVVDGTFPDYTRVMPKAGKFHAHANREYMLKAVTRLAGVMGKGNGALRVNATDSELEHYSDETGRSVIVVQMHSESNVIEPFKFGVNVQYLKETLDAFDGDLIFFDQASTGDPVLFHGNAGPRIADGLRIVMPMRVEW